MHQPGSKQVTAPDGSVDRIDAFGWGLIFTWAGVAFLADVGWRAGILGVGLIALGAQGARRYVGLRFDLFGLAMGVAMVAWGAWGSVQQRFGTLDVPGAFWPVLFIAVGIALLMRAVLGGPPRHRAGSADVQGEEA